MSSINSTFDMVIPNGNEEEFIERALALGYTEIVFLSMNINYVKPNVDTIKVKTAYLLKEVSEIPQAKRRFDYVCAKSERKYFESKIDFILDSELSDRKDSFHYKSTGLNQVHASLVKENEIQLVISFSNLFLDMSNVLGKLFQNAVLIKKYRLNYVTFSVATRPELMRSKTILTALESVLGL